MGHDNTRQQTDQAGSPASAGDNPALGDLGQPNPAGGTGGSATVPRRGEGRPFQGAGGDPAEGKPIDAGADDRPRNPDVTRPADGGDPRAPVR